MSTTNDQTATAPGDTNRLREVEPDTDMESPKFRDFTIEPPKPPIRLTLDPPIEFDGEKFSELIFDFDSLIAKDFVRAERTFLRIYKPDKNETTVLPEMHNDYHVVLAAQVANVPMGVIYKLPRRYWNPVRLEVLKACGSSPDEEKV